MALRKTRSSSNKKMPPETSLNEVEQLRTQFGMLSKEISSFKYLLEDLLIRQKVKPHVYLNKMLVKCNKRLIIVYTDDIDWIEAWGDYVRLHCKGKSHIIRQKIGEVETRLDPQRFLRIGRSAIINIGAVKELEPLNHGDYLITLQDNTQLNLSRNYRDRLISLFDDHE